MYLSETLTQENNQIHYYSNNGSGLRSPRWI